ncbi:DUF4326 domain-containing protein [Phenylobacterium sp.]|uniref:DUF4326 domain-containing protein n=1 Tax=Phenylobacterium sp. TaxID=1871053 RepID=UPI0025EF4955|nr:DUF4326 domain-containing protein [Phenylobacterium sp.]
MPEGTVYVGRGTPWGNPFVVGRDGTAAECVHLYRVVLAGYLFLTEKATAEEQMALARHVLAHMDELRGRDLACWCRFGAPCHADVLLEVANADGPGF